MSTPGTPAAPRQFANSQGGTHPPFTLRHPPAHRLKLRQQPQTDKATVSDHSDNVGLFDPVKGKPVYFASQSGAQAELKIAVKIALRDAQFTRHSKIRGRLAAPHRATA